MTATNEPFRFTSLECLGEGLADEAGYPLISTKGVLDVEPDPALILDLQFLVDLVEFGRFWPVIV